MKHQFCIDAAGCIFGISAIYETTESFCGKYITDDPPDFQIEIDSSDIEFERTRFKKLKNGEAGQYSYSDQYFETLALCRKISEQLPHMNRILFHGAAVSADGAGYIFAAKSGTGKSTHARLWREYLGEHVIMINDDKPILEITDEGVYVYGSPWDGKHHLSNRICCPLKSICFLSRDTTNYIRQVNSKDVYPMLLQQVYRPLSSISMQKTLLLIDKLKASAAFYSLHCNMENEAAVISYNGMR